VTLALNSNDLLYADIRNYNVQKIGGYLKEKAKDIQEQYATFRGNKKGMELTDMKAFVRKIPELQKTYKSLTNHIAVVELIKTRTSTPEFNELWQTERTMLEGDQEYDKIEEMMAVQQPLVKVLRLLCLQSLTNGGIKAKSFDHLRRELLQTWGFELLFTLNNLEKLEMLRKKDSSWLEKESNWDQLRNGLKLINEDVDAFEPDDISYVTSGYAPLTCRLVEHVVRHGGWSGIKEQMRKLAGTGTPRHPHPPSFSPPPPLPLGPTKEVLQSLQLSGEDDENDGDGGGDGDGAGIGGAAGGGGAKASSTPAAGTGVRGARGKKVMVVYFIGGVTYMEIAALRFISKQDYCPFDIIIATTKLLNGNSLIKSLIADIQNKLVRE
jgi:hypothetical protein